MPTPAYKPCIDCGEVKPLADFYRHKEMRDGHLNRCKRCHVARSAAHAKAHPDRVNPLKRKWARENREKVAEKNRQWEQANPDRIAAKKRREYERHPEKPKARKAVYEAVRDGRLTRPPRCEDCGAAPTGSSKIEAHHADYSKPLEVVWLCSNCHRIIHRPSAT